MNSAPGNDAVIDASKSPVASSNRSRRFLLFASVLACLWIVALAVLAAFTANPVTLNQDQIRRSGFIVTATVVDLETSRVLIDQEWRGGALQGEIVVRNLRETSAESRRKYILPLSRANDGKDEFVVTGSLVPVSASEPEKKKPLIYPADDDAIGQLKEILARQAEHRDPENM